MGFMQNPPAAVYARAHGKTKCMYGNACTRANPQHWRDFDHDKSHPRLQSPLPSLTSPPPADAAGAETDDEETDEDEPVQVMSLVSTEAALAAAVEAIAQMGGEWRVGLIAGDTGSGKTRLLDALVARGIVGPAEKKEMWPQHTPVALLPPRPSPSRTTRSIPTPTPPHLFPNAPTPPYPAPTSPSLGGLPPGVALRRRAGPVSK